MPDTDTDRQNAIEQLQSELADVYKANERLADERDDVYAANERLATEFDEINGQLETLQAQVAVTGESDSVAIESLRDDLDNVNRKFAEQARELAELQESNKALCGIRDAEANLRLLAGEAELELDTLRQDYEKEQAASAKLRRENESLSKRLSEKEYQAEKLQQLSSDQVIVAAQLDAQRGENVRLKREWEDSQSRLESIREQLAAAQIRESEFRQEAEQLRTQLKKATLDSEQSEQRLSRLQADLEQAGEEAIEQLQVKQTEIERLRDELNQIKQAAETESKTTNHADTISFESITPEAFAALKPDQHQDQLDLFAQKDRNPQPNEDAKGLDASSPAPPQRAVEADSRTVSKKKSNKDKLTLISGLGPKTRDLLAEHQIETFQQLAATSVDQLKTILSDAGGGFRAIDPSSWPDQASTILAQSD